MQISSMRTSGRRKSGAGRPPSARLNQAWKFKTANEKGLEDFDSESRCSVAVSPLRCSLPPLSARSYVSRIDLMSRSATRLGAMAPSPVTNGGELHSDRTFRAELRSMPLFSAGFETPHTLKLRVCGYGSRSGYAFCNDCGCRQPYRPALKSRMRGIGAPR